MMLALVMPPPKVNVPLLEIVPLLLVSELPLTTVVDDTTTEPLLVITCACNTP